MSLLYLSSKDSDTDPSTYTVDWQPAIEIGQGAFGKVTLVDLQVDPVSDSVDVDTDVTDVYWQFRANSSSRRTLAQCKIAAGNYGIGNWPNQLTMSLNDCYKTQPGGSGDSEDVIMEFQLAVGADNTLTYQMQLLDDAPDIAEWNDVQGTTDGGSGKLQKTAATNAWDACAISKTYLAPCTDSFANLLVGTNHTKVWSWGLFGDEVTPTVNDPDNVHIGVKTVAAGNYHVIQPDGTITDTGVAPAADDEIYIERKVTSAFIPQWTVRIVDSVDAERYNQNFSAGSQHLTHLFVVQRLYTASMLAANTYFIETALAYTDADGNVGTHPQLLFPAQRGNAIEAVPKASQFIIRPGGLSEQMGIAQAEMTLIKSTSWKFTSQSFTSSVRPKSLSVVIPQLGIRSVNGETGKISSSVCFAVEQVFDADLQRTVYRPPYRIPLQIPIASPTPFTSLSVLIRNTDGSAVELEGRSIVTLLLEQ